MNVADIFHLKYIGKAYAHFLSSNENAALLAMFYQIQTEAELAPILYTLDNSVKQDQSDSDIEMIVSYLYYAVEKFVDDYVGKSILNNPTIQALSFS